VGYGYRGWLAADRNNRTIILTQNLIPDSEANNPNWRAEGAAGDFNGYARQLARTLVQAGFNYSVIRLGHEMNGTGYDDGVGDTKVSERQWAQYFAQIVTTMRAVPGAHFLFDWNVNAGVAPIPFSQYYPGNKYVDIIGIDFYDVSVAANPPPASSPARWNVLSGEPYGLDALAAFATRHGKPLSIPEWGTVSDAPDAGYGGTGGGDDASYVTHIGAFVASHDVAYQSWFDDGDAGILELTATSAPRSLAAYAKAFGHGRS
jgi:beta-mannanase